MNIVKKAHQWFIFIGKQYLLMLNLFTPILYFIIYGSIKLHAEFHQ